jgi:hypothetical protein
MCLQCSDNISQEDRISQLKELVKNGTEFELFNTTSVMILFYSCLEMYGPECKELAIQVLRDFVDWYYNNKQICYMPYHGIEPMYHPKVIEEMLNWCEDQENYINREKPMTNFVIEFKKVEENVLQENRTKKYLYGSIFILGIAFLYKNFR